MSLIDDLPVPAVGDAPLVPRPLGQILLSLGSVDPATLADALERQAVWGGRLGETLLALGRIGEDALARALAAQFDLPLVERLPFDPQPGRPDLLEAEFHATALLMPMATAGQGTLYAAVDPVDAPHLIRDRCGQAPFALVLASRAALRDSLDRRYGPLFGDAAGHRLYRAQPHYSARHGLSLEQKPVVLGGAASLVLAGIAAPLETAMNIGVAGAAAFSASLALRLAVAAAGLAAAPRRRRHLLRDLRSLPVYTILVPLYREARALPGLIAALRALRYAPAKLDIKLIVEADDSETRQAIDREAPPPIFEVVTVPAIGPRTKPKACNYALHYARGDYVVIFDAEDRPDPDQLLEAVAAFRAGPPDLGCVQARLRYYNADENWLTRQFALEYLLWFDLILPGLQRLGIPLPLGGTSNHFPTALLRRLGAWDPYNVTEDADLGLRLAQEGYRTAVLDSVTDEEAAKRLGVWLRQRTRWLKGYLQTYLVHMRRPSLLYRRIGPAGFFGFQLLIGGTVAAALLHPLWLIAVAAPLVGADRPGTVRTLCLALLAVGDLCAVVAGAVAALRRGHIRLLPATLGIPVYWLLISAAGYRALWHWLRRPHHWEKTEHGLTAIEWRPPS